MSLFYIWTFTVQLNVGEIYQLSSVLQSSWVSFLVAASWKGGTGVGEEFDWVSGVARRQKHDARDSAEYQTRNAINEVGCGITWFNFFER